GEAVLGDERVGGKVAVMAQAVGVPGGLGEDRRGGGVEEGGGFVEVGQADGGGDFFEDGREAVEAFAGGVGEGFVEAGGIDEDKAGAGCKVVGEAGAAGLEF